MSKGDFRIRIPKNATPEEIQEYMKAFNKQWNENKKDALYCQRTKHLCGTDTWGLKGCSCDNCQLWIKRNNWP
jgi:hypothetical protein